MSLISLLDEINKDYLADQAMFYVMKHMDFKKFGERINQARKTPNEVTKCVLFEFLHTTWEDIKLGAPDISDRLPETDEYLFTVLNSKSFQDLARKILGNNNPNINIYVRSRINSNNAPDIHKKQLVVIFEKGAYSLPSQINLEDCNCDNCEDARISIRPYSSEEEGECDGH